MSTPPNNIDVSVNNLNEPLRGDCNTGDMPEIIPSYKSNKTAFRRQCVTRKGI
jgi:hypothetical protein